MRRTLQFLYSLVGVMVFAICTSTMTFAQSPLCGETENLSVFFDTAKIYPAMTPRTHIKVGYAALLPPDDVGGPPLYQFNSSSPASYVLIDSKNNVYIPEKVDSVRAEGVAYLSFDPRSAGLEKDEKLTVGIKAKRRTQTGSRSIIVCHSGEQITIPETDMYTLRIKPGYAAKQELKDGSKKDVAHMELDLDVPSLIPNENVARFYFLTKNLFSTNNKDKATKLDFRLGAERSLMSSWYVPGNLEAKFLGDQPLDNTSFVLSSGIKTILPWGWTRKLLFNSLIKAPVSPEFEFSGQYERRYRQDADNRKKYPHKDSIRIFGQMGWNPIHLLTGETYTPNDVSLEIYGRGWFFPYERTNTGTRVRKLEGQIEISLYIPVANLSIANGGVFVKKPETGVTNRLRFKYTIGANEANGFKRSSVFTIGIEALK